MRIADAQRPIYVHRSADYSNPGGTYESRRALKDGLHWLSCFQKRIRARENERFIFGFFLCFMKDMRADLGLRDGGERVSSL